MCLESRRQGESAVSSFACWMTVGRWRFIPVASTAWVDMYATLSLCSRSQQHQIESMLLASNPCPLCETMAQAKCSRHLLTFPVIMKTPLKFYRPCFFRSCSQSCRGLLTGTIEPESKEVLPKVCF